MSDLQNLPSTTQAEGAALRFRLETLVAGAFALMGVFVAVYCSLTLQFKAAYGPGPAFAPVLTGIALAIVAGVKLLTLLKADRSWLTAMVIDPAELRKSIVVVILSVAAVALMDILGSTVSMAIFCLIIMRWIQKEPWLASILTALLMPAALVWAFREPLAIPLPSGYLF